MIRAFISLSFFGYVPLVRQPIGSTAHWSDSPLVRQPIGPTTHWFDNQYLIDNLFCTAYCDSKYPKTVA